MSFAQETKQNLSEIFIKKECCAFSLLWGIVRYAGVFDAHTVRLLTHSEGVMKLTLELLKRGFDIDGEVRVRAFSGKEHIAYRLTLSEAETSLIRNAYHFDGDTAGIGTLDRIFRCDKCTPAFVRGLFLSCGNIADPSRSYHLDLTMPDEKTALDTAKLLEEAGLAPKRATRKQLPILYYKGSEGIEDFLTYIGATKSAFSMMDTKIWKDVRNETNRRQNFDLANLEKIVSGAQVHIDAIRRLQETGKFALLPDELRQTAILRLENPEMSLCDLAAAHEPRLTKSGLNHRLRKLVALAADAED